MIVALKHTDFGLPYVISEYYLITDYDIGRTLSQCKAAYEQLRFGSRTNISPLPPQYPPLVQQQQFPQGQQKRKSDSSILGHPYMSGEPSGKRRQSGIESMAGARSIQPKPPSGGDPSGTAVALAAPPQKRRGRPPKMEVERRNRDAMQRGEVFPAQIHGMPPLAGDFTASPYTPIAPSPSIIPGPPTSQVTVEQNVADDQTEDSPGRRKRQKGPAKPPRVSESHMASTILLIAVRLLRSSNQVKAAFQSIRRYL